MGGDQEDLCALDVWLPPSEGTNQDVMVVRQEVPIYQGRGGSSHGQRGRLVISTLPDEGDPDPVDNGTTIYLSYGANDRPSESLTFFSGQDISI